MVTSVPRVMTLVLNVALGGALLAGDDPAVEDDLDGVGAAEVEVVGDQGLEERSGVAGLGEYDGAGDLDLGHRQFPPVAGLLVGGAERQREPGQPPLEEHVDRAGLQRVADPLQQCGILAGRRTRWTAR